MWDKNVQRKIYGLIKEDSHYRIKTNPELMDIYGEPGFVSFVDEAMDHSALGKKIIKYINLFKRPSYSINEDSTVILSWRNC